MSSITYSAEPIQFNINGVDVMNLRNPGSANSSVVFNGARAITLPVGNNTSDRPTSPTAGMIRYQNTSNNLEFYNGTSWVTVGPTPTLQQVYDSSTNPELVLDSTRGALTVRDNATPIGANLFEVQNNAGTTTFFNVTVQGAGLQLGSASSPSLFFQGDTNTGMYSAGAEQINFTTNGTLRFTIRDPGAADAVATFSGTSAITLPVGNNSTQRPTSPVAGMLRYENTTNNLEFYNGTSWTSVSAGVIVTQWKEPVRVATTTAGSLASSFQNGSIVDGVTLVTGDRILIKNQASAAENGIYIVNASGAPTRATDMDTWAEVPGATVFVNIGTTNADTFWFCTSNPGGTIGTTAITWSQISGSGTLQSAYNASVLGDIIVDTTRGSFKIRDSSVPIFGDLLEVQNNVGNFDYFSVDTQGAKLQNGTANTPSLTFQSDPNTGLFRVDADTIGFATNGIEIARLTTAGLEIGRNAVPVADGEDLGSWDFVGFDGTTNIPGARIFSQVDGTPGTADMPGRLIFATTADGNSVPVERMRITSTGEIRTPNDAGNIGGKLYAWSNFV